MDTADLDLDIPSDEQTMRLAHPLRCTVCLEALALSAWEHFLGPKTWSALTEGFQAQDAMTSDVLSEMMNKQGHVRLAQMADALSQSAGNTEMGSTFSMMLFLRHHLSPQPHFLMDDALVEMLEHTDLSDDIPVSMLKTPYSRMYLEFGRLRNIPQRVPNPISGRHVLEGAYIEAGVSETKGPGIFVMFTGSPVGHRDAMDDATSSLFIPTADPERPLREALLAARRSSGELARDLGLPPAPDAYIEDEVEAMTLLARCLLFLSVPQARRTLRKELTEARAAALAKKNPAKRAKAEKALRRLSDHILVSAPPVHTEGRDRGDGKGVRMHWRRGHYRMQRHGPANTLQKLIFLQPALIGAPDAEAPAPAGRYVAKA